MKPLAFVAVLVAALHISSSSALAAGDWTWPVHGQVITQYRNGSDPYAAGQHRGIDIAAPVGDAVVAATPGKVTFAGVAGTSGLTVSIRTADGRFDTSYLHLSSTSVRAGQPVAAGQRIGAVGISGRRSAEQPHLHFGVREAAQRQAYRDPLDFLAPPAPAPRPEPAPPHGVPVPVGNHAPIPLPGALLAPLASRSPAGAPAAPPRALASSLPAPRTYRAPGHAGPGHAAPGRHAPLPATAGSPAPAGIATTIAAPPTRHAEMAPHPGAAASALHAPGAAPSPTRDDANPRVRLGDGPRSVAASSPERRVSVAHRDAGPAPSGRGGLDIGWLAACVGLVAAACALGRPDGAKAAAVRGREAFATLLRPLDGRPR